MKRLDPNKSLVCRYNKEYIEEDKKQVFDENIDAEIVYHAHPQGVEEGRESFLNFFEQVLKPAVRNLRVDIKERIAEDDKVVTLKSYKGRLKQEDRDGEKTADDGIMIDVMDIIHSKNAKFLEYWHVMGAQNEGEHFIMERNYVF